MPKVTVTQRKENSEAFLRNIGFPINEALPTIESVSAIRSKMQKPREVAQRAYYLTTVSDPALYHKGYGPKLLERIRKWWHETGLLRLLSPSEQTLVNSSYDNEELIRRMSWRGEAAQFLLWALGVFKELPLPCKGIDIVDVLWPHIPKALSGDPEHFFSASKLRPIEEILDKVDIIYRMNWACTDQRLGGQEVPKLNHTVVWERTYASNWLVGYPDGYLTIQKWDEVVVDT